MRRACAWERHYRRREIASHLCTLGWSGTRVIQALTAAGYPEPELDVDGDLLSVPLYLRQGKQDELLSLLKIQDHALLCVWYWTEMRWMQFVRQFQSLPDVYEDYYYRYEPLPVDRIVLVPMSSKPKQGCGKPVDKPVKRLLIKSRKKVHLPDFSLTVDERV